MSPAPELIAALPFPLAYEVSCRTRTGSVRHERPTRSAISPFISLASCETSGSPVLPGGVRHEQLRQTSKFSTRWSYSRYQPESTRKLFECYRTKEQRMAHKTKAGGGLPQPPP